MQSFQIHEHLLCVSRWTIQATKNNRLEIKIGDKRMIIFKRWCTYMPYRIVLYRQHASSYVPDFEFDSFQGYAFSCNCCHVQLGEEKGENDPWMVVVG